MDATVRKAHSSQRVSHSWLAGLSRPVGPLVDRGARQLTVRLNGYQQRHIMIAHHASRTLTINNVSHIDLQVVE